MFVRFQVNLPRVHRWPPPSRRLIGWIGTYEVPNYLVFLGHQLFSVLRRALLRILCLGLLSWVRRRPGLAFKPFPCPEALIHQINSIICLHGQKFDMCLLL